MAKTATSPLVQLLRCVAEDHRVKQLTDQQLLERFRSARDEAAFQALLRRHGAMVLDVCRHVLGNEADSEDAFQATFLVLAQKAAAIRKHTAVGSWLYGVAYRTARKAQQRCARRRRREMCPVRLPAAASADDFCWPEVRQVLHEELTRISHCYQAPLVACYLEGKTQDEAARLLGVSKTTLKKRLDRGRALLRARLVRRGLGAPAVLLTAAWPAATVSAQLLPRLVAPTIRAARLLAAGHAAPAGMISAKVAALTQEVLKTMFLTRLKTTMAALLVAGVLVSGLLIAGLGALPVASQAQPPATPRGPAPPQPQAAAKAAGPGILLLARGRDLVALHPDGKQQNELAAPDQTRSTHEGRLSPDRSRAAFVVDGSKPRMPGSDLDAPWELKLVIRKLGTKEAKVMDFPGHGLSVRCWSPDGKRLVVIRWPVKDQPPETLWLDPETGKTEPLDLPAGVRVLDCGRDGKTFLVVYLKDRELRLGLAEKGSAQPRELTALKARLEGGVAGRLSPSGKRVLFTDADPRQKDAYKWNRSSQPHVLDVATRQRQPLAEFPENAQCVGVAWSPDGKQVAYTWTQLHADVLQKDVLKAADMRVPTEAFLIVADADGKNVRTIASERSNQALHSVFGSIDWR